MSSDLLSQAEVDALLKGVTGEADCLEPAAPSNGVRPYNLATQERIVRGRMPTLESINDRFARLLRIGLFNFVRRSPEISVGPVKVQQYSEFVRHLAVPTNLNIVQIKPLRGSCLFVFDPTLVFSVVDNLFGGDGRFQNRVDGREFTQTEQRIIQRMLAVVLEDYRKSWASAYAVDFEHVRSEMYTQFANIAAPAEIVLTTTFNVELGTAGGALHICIPYATVEPIRDLLCSNLQGASYEPDQRWPRMLQKQVQSAEVDLVAKLACIKVNLQHITGMKVGDVIPFDLPDSVVADVDGVPIFECRYGTVNGRYAIRVERILAVAHDNSSLGERHV